LQIIYWFMNIVGWITWHRKDKKEKLDRMG
jgi:hypothetical protein